MSIKRIENRERTALFVKNHIINPKKSYEDITTGNYLSYFAELDFQYHFPNAVCDILGIQFNEKDKGERHRKARDELVNKLPHLTYTPDFAKDPQFIEHLKKTDIQNIDNWMLFKRSIRGNSGKGKKSSGKDTIYRLCLGLFTESDSIERTMEFFLKACMFPPFNTKRLEDVVFYYCIKYHKTIDDVYRIIDSIPVANIQLQNSLETIGLDAMMDKIGNDENSLREYILSHCCYDSQLEYSNALSLIDDLDKRLKYQGIKIKFKSLVGKISTVVGRDNKREKFDNAWMDIESMLRNRKDSNGDPVFNATEIICIHTTLNHIIETFPLYQSTNPIKKYDGDKTELIRRTLIVRFLTYYFNNQDEGVDPNKSYEEFCNYLDGHLHQCGFIQTYPLNPFDFLILLCASKCAYCNSQNQGITNPLYEIIQQLFSYSP